MSIEKRESGSVSVIIPAYKAERTICRAIDSVLSQTLPPAEIIVIDDGSPDRQHVAIRSYGDRILCLRQPNRGAAMARNAGIDHAQGDFLAFLDADDYWEAEKLERQLALFARYPQVGVIGGGYYVQQTSGARSAVGGKTRWHDRVLRVRGERAFRLSTMLWTGTVIVRREVLGNERFVSGLEPAEDRDLWVRLVRRGPAYLISEPLSTAVMEPGSLSRSGIDRDCSKMLEVIDRHRPWVGLLGSLAWRSHTLYRWAGMDASPRSALPRLFRSFVLWPLPYLGVSGMLPLGRLRRLGVLVLLALRLRTSEAANG